MNELAVHTAKIQPMSDTAIGKVYALERVTGFMEQADIETYHVLHGGMYARTIKIPGGVVLTGALVKIPTTLVINGDVTVYVDNDEILVTGYQVIPASAHRKQAFITHSDTLLTMVFPTSAATIEEAEDEFTEEASLLMSRKSDAKNFINITGE